MIQNEAQAGGLHSRVLDALHPFLGQTFIELCGCKDVTMAAPLRLFEETPGYPVALCHVLTWGLWDHVGGETDEV